MADEVGVLYSGVPALTALIRHRNQFNYGSLHEKNHEQSFCQGLGELEEKPGTRNWLPEVSWDGPVPIPECSKDLNEGPLGFHIRSRKYGAW